MAIGKRKIKVDLWRRSVVVGVSFACLLASACGSSEQPVVNRSASPPKSPASPPVAVNSSDESGRPENSSRTPDAVSFADRVNRMRNRPDADPGATPPPLTYRPAPENSRIAVTMEPDGSVLEVRIFDGHPQLTRVEARPQPSAPTRFRIFLKNGRSVRAESSRILNLQTVPSSDLLALAGGKAADRSRIANENR